MPQRQMQPSNPIPTILTNRHARFLCSPSVQQELRDQFSYFDPKAEHVQTYLDGRWDGRRCMLYRGQVDAGLFLGMWEALKVSGFRFQVRDLREPPVFHVASSSSKARDYQVQAVAAMVRASKTGGLILSATGTGKTYIVAELLKRLKGRGLFVCDELTLLEQSRRMIGKVTGETIGVVGRGEFHPGRITVATVQTLDKHCRVPKFVRWFSSVDVVVLDEIHVALNHRSINVIRAVSPKAVYGLTATLEMQKQDVRMKAMALAGPILFSYSIQEGVDDKVLTPGTVCRVLFTDPQDNRWNGSPEADYRYRIALNPHRNSCIAKLAREGVRRGRYVIVLVERIQHLRILSQEMQDIDHRVLHGQYSYQARTAAKEAMDGGTLHLIIASRIFSRGIDIKRVDVIIDATGFPSRNSAIQRYGRGVRRGEGKGSLLFIDIADHNNQFAAAARSRWKALMELGMMIKQIAWMGDPAKVYNL